MAFTDFPNGLFSADDYLSASNSVNAQLTGSTADISRLVVSAELDVNLKEIICSLLAGRGLKLPNIQICISLNLKELLGNFASTIQQTLFDALTELDEALDSFLNHLKLDEVLGRINNVIAEITNIANMINFCSSPLDPIRIPNVLEGVMESFLGNGADIIGRIGSLVPDGIGGCLIDGSVNCAAFDGGILGDICNNFTDVTTGVATDTFIDATVTECNAIITAISDIIARETSVAVTYDNGGSDLEEDTRPVNEGIGTLFNASDEGISGASRNASQLWHTYLACASYQLVDTSGGVHDNCFELFCDDDLLRVLRRTPEPSPEIAEQVPVFNYCGEVVGFTKVVTQVDPEQSVGSVPTAISQPGFNAGGIPTNPVTEAALAGGVVGGDITNQITNLYTIEGGVLFVDSEAELLTSGAIEGQLVYRTDNRLTYVHNGGTSGTITDYNVIGGGAGAGSLNPFLTDINAGSGSGIVVRDGDFVHYRSILGTSNQITVANGDGTASGPTISITSNPIIPGTDAIVVPIGTTGERVSTINGALRFNSSTSSFEGYQGGSWLAFATGGGSVTNGSNVGGGTYEVFKQNNGGTLEFRTFDVSGAITFNVSADIITVGESLTASSLGSGSEVFKQRATNDFEFRSITAGTGITIVENANDIEISSGAVSEGTVNTTNNTLTEVLFGGSRLTPGSNICWFFTVTAVANRSDDTDATAIKIEGLVDNNAGTVTIVGTAGNKTVYNSTSPTVNYDLTLDILSNEFRIRVNGDTGHTVDWKVNLEFIESP